MEVRARAAVDSAATPRLITTAGARGAAHLVVTAGLRSAALTGAHIPATPPLDQTPR